MQKRIQMNVLAAAAAVTLSAGPALAANFTWDGGGADDLWSNGLNWVGDVAPPTASTGNNLFFGDSATDLTADMNADYTANLIRFQSNGGYILNSTTASTATLLGNGLVPNLALDANIAGTSTVNFDLNFPNASDIRSNLASANLVVNGDITAAGQISKDGAGRLTLGGSNNFAGGILIKVGSLGLASNAGLGSAGQTLTHDNGNVVSIVAVGGPRTLDQNFALGNGNNNMGVLAFGEFPSAGPGTQPLITINGTVTQSLGQTGSPTRPDGNRFDVRTDQTVQVNGLISGAGIFQKTGQGTLTLNNSNVGLTGGLDHFAGTIVARTDAALGSGTYYAREGTATLLGGDGPRTFANPINLGGPAGAAPTNALEIGSVAIGMPPVPQPVTFTGPVTLERLGTVGIKPISVFADTVVTFTGTIDDGAETYGITATGPGTLVLDGVNSYGGPTNVALGTLEVNGSIATSSQTFVGAGTLQGSGIVGPLIVTDADLMDAVVGGILSPGDETLDATLTAASAGFGAAGKYLFNLNSVAGVGNDLLALTGALTASATSTNPFIIDVDGPPAGFLDNVGFSVPLVTASSVNGFDPSKFTLDLMGVSVMYSGTFSIDATPTSLNLTYTPVPEPTLASLLVLGGLPMLRRRR